MAVPDAQREIGLELPSPMTLQGLQDYVARAVAAREFTQHLNEVFILMTEELGELAREIAGKGNSPGAAEAFDDGNLAFELADLALYLLDLANGFQVSLAALWPAHEQALEQRHAAQPKGPPPGSFDPEWGLNMLVAHQGEMRNAREWGDSPEQLLTLLTGEAGKIARELRKHWKDRTTPERAGGALIDALRCLFRLTLACGIDLERAVREKEAHNAERTWEF